MLPVVFLPWSSTPPLRTCCLLFLPHFLCGLVACCFLSLGRQHSLCGRLASMTLSDKQLVLYLVKEGEREIAPPLKRRRRRGQHTCLHARVRAFFSCTVHASLMFGSRPRRLNVFAQKSSHLCVMSLLGVPSRLFPAVFSSLTRPSASSTPLTGTRRSPCALPPWCGMSGYLAHPTSDTGYEPKFCVDARDEHTPINLSESNRNFPHDYDATITATTEGLDVLRHSGASSRSQRTAAASRVPTVSKRGSLGIASGNGWQIMSRFTVVIALGTLVQTQTQKPLFPNQDGREIETKTLCRPCLLTWKISIKSLSGKVNWPSEERKWLSRNCMTLRQTWRLNIGKREIQMWLFMRSTWSSNLNDFSYNKRIDGQTRLKELQWACTEKWKCGIDSSENIMQKIAKTLKS